MTVTVYKSTDASAPVLNGAIGSLVTLLDACLINGYGSQPAAGWSIAFSSSNQRSYKQGAGGNNMNLFINDTTTLYSSVIGYENMTGITTGTGAFPSTQSAFPTGCFWTRSNDTGTTRAWVVIATQKAFYLWINVSGDAAPYGATSQIYFFGDIVSYKPSDAYNTLLMGSTATTGTTVIYSISASTTTTLAGHYMPRFYNQFSTVPATIASIGKHSDALRCGTSIGRGALTYPNPEDGALILSPIWIHENIGGGVIRGYLPGAWAPGHTLPLNHLDTVSGNPTGALTGKTFIAINCFAGSSNVNAGQFIIETSNTW